MVEIKPRRVNVGTNEVQLIYSKQVKQHSPPIVKEMKIHRKITSRFKMSGHLHEAMRGCKGQN